MGASEKQQLREWAALAERRGWRVVLGGSHLKWYPPNGGKPLGTASTPGGGNRSIDNIRAKLRRAGLREI